MTDQPKPDLAAIIAAVDDLGQNLAAAARRAWPRVAAALTPTQDEFVLAPNDVEQPKRAPIVDPDDFEDTVTRWLSARNALRACLDGDDEAAARHLGGLDDAALYAIEGAGSALALHASRLRRDLLAAQAVDEEPDDESVCDEPTCICHDLAAPDDDAGGRVSVDEYERLLTQDEQPDEASAGYDLDTDPEALRRNLGEIIRILDGRGPKMTLDAVWARVRPVLRSHREKLAEQRQRADKAERARARAVQRAQAAEQERNDETECSKRFAGYLNAARDAAGAPNWEVLADVITALRAEHDASRDENREQRARIDALGDEARALATDLAQERRAAETYREQRDAARKDAEEASRLHARALMIEQPATFREWLRAEVRRDPAWWREILRRELRLGFLAQDFRRAGIRAD